MRHVHTRVVFLVLALVLGACAENASTGASQESLRGTRYCEILAVVDEGGFRADVYGSECPAEQWEALDLEAIQEELGALAILRNGAPVLADRRCHVLQ